MVNVNQIKAEQYECASCIYTWHEKKCVKENNIRLRSTKVFFCLNRDIWVKDKSEGIINICNQYVILRKEFPLPEAEILL